MVYDIKHFLAITQLFVWCAALHFGQLGSDNVMNYLVRFYIGV